MFTVQQYSIVVFMYWFDKDRIEFKSYSLTNDKFVSYSVVAKYLRLFALKH